MFFLILFFLSCLDYVLTIYAKNLMRKILKWCHFLNAAIQFLLIIATMAIRLCKLK